MQRVERATPPERVRLVLYYFDTCRAVTARQTMAFGVLDNLDALAQRQRDDQLRTQFADLTPAEERLVALSKLKIDTNQMGQMLGISPSSVRPTKYRLRKRLGIHEQSSLLALLE